MLTTAYDSHKALTDIKHSLAYDVVAFNLTLAIVTEAIATVVLATGARIRGITAGRDTITPKYGYVIFNIRVLS